MKCLTNNIFKPLSSTNQNSSVGVLLPSIGKYAAWPTIRRNPINNDLMIVYTSTNHHICNDSEIILLTSSDEGCNWKKHKVLDSYYNNSSNLIFNILPKSGTITVSRNLKKIIFSWSNKNNYYYKFFNTTSQAFVDLYLNIWSDEYEIRKPSIIELKNLWVEKLIKEFDYPYKFEFIEEWVKGGFPNGFSFGNFCNPEGNMIIGWYQEFDDNNDYTVTISKSSIRLGTRSAHGGAELHDGSLIFISKGYIPSKNNKLEEKIIVEHFKKYADPSGKLLLAFDFVSIIPYPIKEINNVNFDVRLSEPCVVECCQGDILVIFRNDDCGSQEQDAIDRDPKHAFYFARSKDSGKSWSSCVPFLLKDTTGNTISFQASDAPEVIKLSNGDLLFTFSERMNQTISDCKINYAILKKGDITWQNSKNLITHNSHPSNFGNPSSVEMLDGTILTVWYQQVSPLRFNTTHPQDMTWLFACNWRL